MQPLPHSYAVSAMAAGSNPVDLTAQGLVPMTSSPPVEFDGPGDLWSPETLLMAAVADCFVLTFRAVATASRLRWSSVNCDVTGTLDRIEGITRFTAIHLQVRLMLPPDSDAETARKVVAKAEKGCLVANSLKAVPTFDVAVDFDDPPIAY